MSYSGRYATILVFLLKLLNGHAQDTKPQTTHLQLPDSVILLNEVTVEGYHLSNKLQTFPGSLAVLSGKSLNLSDGTNLATMLNTIPGISMQSGTYATNRIVMRGMGSRTPYNSNRIRSYLNNIPLTSSDGISTPEEIDQQSLGRIEVIKGPASALYGSGLGGSINLFTPLNLQNKGSLSAGYGSLNTLKTYFSGTINTKNTNLWGSLSHLQSDGYRENNEYKRTSLLTTAQWKQPKWSVKSTLMLIDVKAEIPSSLGKTQFENNPQAAAANWSAIEGYKKYRKAMAGITFSKIISSKLTNQFTFHGKWSESYEKRPFNNLSEHTLSAGIRNKLSYYRSKTDWILGIDWIAEQYKWKLDKNEILLNENRENRNHFSIFGITNYRPHTRFNISMAATLNHINYQLTDLFSVNGDQSGKRDFPLIFSPRIGFNYAATDKSAVYVSAGHGFSLPSPEETLLPAGEVNPDIKPEQGMQYETGIRVNFFNKAFELDASLYWIELNDLLVTKRVTEDIFTGMNAGKTRHQGFELLLRNRLFNDENFPGKLNSTFSYTLSRNRFIDFTDNSNTYDGKHLPGIPDQIMQLQISWSPLNRLEVFTHLQYTGNQYLNDANSLSYEGFFLIDMKATIQFEIKKAGTFAMYAGVNNLTDTRYASMLVVNAIGFGNNEPRYYYPGLPRNMYAGIQFLF